MPTKLEIQKEIEALKSQLAAETDTATRNEIQRKITAAEKRLQDLETQTPDSKTPDRPDKQFFTVREWVEMALVGGGGALGGLIAYIFKEAKIWTFVPPNAGIIHCVGAGALAAGLAVWFIARTDRNQRVPCFLFAILCGLAGLKMIEKAATTILPEVDIFAPAALADADKNVNAANKAAKEVQESSRPENVEAAKANIDKVGDSIENLTTALNKATSQGDANAVTVLDKSLSEATQSLAKIKFENQSIPEVAKKAEDVLNKTASPAVAKTAEQKELDALKDKYLKVTQSTGWFFLGSYNNGKWDRPTTGNSEVPDHLQGKELKVTNPVYLRGTPPAGADYKLGEVVNALFEGDTVTVDKVQPIQRPDGVRIWAHVSQIKRAGAVETSGSTASPAPIASVTPAETTPENSSPAKRRARKRPR
jgi:hypothetical protein